MLPANSETDKLFQNVAACVTFLEFQKFLVRDDVDVTIKSISRLATFMTTMVDGMKSAAKFAKQSRTDSNVGQRSTLESKITDKRQNYKVVTSWHSRGVVSSSFCKLQYGTCSAECT